LRGGTQVFFVSFPTATRSKKKASEIQQGGHTDLLHSSPDHTGSEQEQQAKLKSKNELFPAHGSMCVLVCALLLCVTLGAVCGNSLEYFDHVLFIWYDRRGLTKNEIVIIKLSLPTPSRLPFLLDLRTACVHKNKQNKR
jgi:hypothetical protein